MTEVVTITLTTTFEYEMEDGDFFDPEVVTGETRAFLSQYGPVLSLEIQHDAIMEGDDDEEEEGE